MRARLALCPVPMVPEVSIYTALPGSGLTRMLSDGHESPYWAWPWAGGIALARYIIDNPTLVAGKSVADFGSGSGLVAIAALKAGARLATAVDADPLAVRAALLNAEANGVSIAPREADALAFQDDGIDVVTFGDLFYGEDLAAQSLKVARHWQSRGATVLIGDPFRRALPTVALDMVAEREVPDVGGVTVRTAIFKLRSAA